MSLLTASEPRTATIQEPDLAIRLEDVSVRYEVTPERINSLKEYVLRRAQRRLTRKEFFALRDVSLEMRRGETLGIIGRNGAGKSTLLKVISRVIRPTEGCVWVRGRVAPLLELGAGFHPELTGRENVFLNGTLLGHPRSEIEERFQEIVDFAEIWEFIEVPLRTYSTGMIARLGFAVATAWAPDILILDEILSAGDAEFQLKSSERIQRIRGEGATVLLVSHSLDAVKEMCDRVAWLERGRIHALGSTEMVSALYHDEVMKLHQVSQLAPRWGSPERFEAARKSGDVYDDFYFAYCCGFPYERNPMWLSFFHSVAENIVRALAPHTVLDAGCGMGFLVEGLRDEGVEGFGIDISRFAIHQVRDDIKAYCRVGSIVDPLPRQYDLIVCIEVLQNLNEAEGTRAIANFCRASNAVLASVNPADRRSATHVNVQPVEYWEKLFAAFGFERDKKFDSSFLTPWTMLFRRKP